MLDGRPVRRISAFLVEGDFDDAPARLAANAGKAFIGSYVLGMGFTFDDAAAAKGIATPIAEMHRLIEKNPKNAERIFPYIGGEEVNNHPRHEHHRYVIDFGDMSEAEAREGWPDLMTIVEEKVRPGRLSDKRKSYRLYWWRFAEHRETLYQNIQSLEHVIAKSYTSVNFSALLISNTVYLFDQTLVIFLYQTMAPFSSLCARGHETWARYFTSTLEDRLRYAPSDCFATFPFPPDFESDAILEDIGRRYYDHRAALMVERNEGLTRTYNRFHNPTEHAADIQTLRDLHAEMDRAVLRAYGWDDLAGRAEPVFLDETNEDEYAYQGRLFWPGNFRDEVLARLLALNAERHADEVRRGLMTPDGKIIRGATAMAVDDEDEDEGEMADD